MKKILIVLFLAVGLASCTQSTKIGYVDIQEVMQEYQGAIDAEKMLQEKSNKLNQQLQEASARFQEKVQKYQSERTKMSAAKQREKENELMQEQQVIQQQQQMVQQQFQEEGNVMIEKINEDIDKKIEAFAKAKGYDIILGTSLQTRTVLYGNEKIDITDAVIEFMNQDQSDETDEPSVTKESDSVKTN